MNKKTGSYYTPIQISNFMVRYIFNKLKDENISILEPSVGDGVFIESLINNGITKFNKKSITILDINKEELRKAEDKIQQFNDKTILHDNFLEFQKTHRRKVKMLFG